MRKILVVLLMTLALPSCSVTTIRYNYSVTKLTPHHMAAATGTIRESVVSKTTLSETPNNVKKVTKIKTGCSSVFFPDLSSMPSPPIEELRSIDPRDKKKINEVMTRYIDKLIEVDKDVRRKYMAVKTTYRQKCSM